MTKQPIDWSVPQRQSAAAVFIVMIKVLLRIVKIGWPFLLLYFFRSSSRKSETWELAGLAISGLAVIGALAELLFFRFSIVNNELVIKSGIVVRNTIVLPLGRIQAVHIERTWLHKLFHSARLSFDSAGSEKVEIRINAVELTKAEALKDFIMGFRRPGEEPGPVPQAQTILTLGTKDLLKLSLSANHLEAFFLLLTFGFSVADDLGKVMGEPRGFREWLMHFARGSSGRALLIFSVGILLISMVVSVARVLLLYLDFTISRSDSAFHIRSGLINEKEKLVPFRKVQFISWRASWLRHKMKLYLLNFHAVGSDEVKRKQQVKVPITRPAFIPLLAQHYHVLLPVETLKPLHIHRSYVFRKTLLAGLLPALVLAGGSFPFIGLYAFFFLALLPLVAIASWLYRKKFRLWATPTALQIRSGRFGLAEVILKWNNIQTIGLQQSPYQRSRELATLKLRTAGGTIAIPYIGHAEALRILNYALYKVESSGEPWL
ncbi:MAG: PH domain-containing protein [Chitinophagaceae bacterium]